MNDKGNYKFARQRSTAAMKRLHLDRSASSRSSSTCLLLLSPSDPSPHGLIHRLDTSLTRLNLKPLSMLLTTSCALPLDLLLRQFQVN